MGHCVWRRIGHTITHTLDHHCYFTDADTIVFSHWRLCAFLGSMEAFADDVSEAESEEEQKAKQARNFRQAIILILTADFMMSLDNIIAVAGTAHGNIVLLIFGLLLSMPLLMTTGGAISLLIDRFKWLVFLGAAVIVFAGTRMIFEDKFIESQSPRATGYCFDRIYIHWNRSARSYLSGLIGGRQNY